MAQHLLHGHFSKIPVGPVCAHPPAGLVPRHPAAIRLQQAVQGRGNAAQRGDHRPSQRHRILARGPPATGFHPGTARGGTSRETVKRSELAGPADYGFCASHSRYFWGFCLYLISTPEGMPVIWGLANPKFGEDEVT